MKQNKRTNKTNQLIIWPAASYFTIKELHKLNPDFVEITLRVRLTHEIEEGRAVELGSISGGKGRPHKVFALTPVTQITISKAKANNITLVDNADRLVNVLSVTGTQPTNPVSPAVLAQSAMLN